MIRLRDNAWKQSVTPKDIKDAKASERQVVADCIDQYRDYCYGARNLLERSQRMDEDLRSWSESQSIDQTTMLLIGCFGASRRLGTIGSENGARFRKSEVRL